MKITMDKKFTPVAQVEIVKAAMKQFKESYTDSDILRVFQTEYEKTNQYLWSPSEILRCNVEACPVWSWSDAVQFYVELVIWNGFDQFWTGRFYCNEALEVIHPTTFYASTYKQQEIMHCTVGTYND